jgi:hypothetical protein
MAGNGFSHRPVTSNETDINVAVTDKLYFLFAEGKY